MRSFLSRLRAAWHALVANDPAPETPAEWFVPARRERPSLRCLPGRPDPRVAAVAGHLGRQLDEPMPAVVEDDDAEGT